MNSGCAEPTAGKSPSRMIEETPETLDGTLAPLTDGPEANRDKMMSIEAARARQFGLESTLNDITDKAAIGCNLLFPVPEGRDSIKQVPRKSNDLGLEQQQEEDPKEVMVDTVTKARENLRSCQAKFDRARREIPPVAASVTSTQAGPLRFTNMRKRTRDLIEAEEECRHAVREAQYAGAIGNEPCQTSNFRDEPREYYHTQTLLQDGCPPPERKKARVEDWLEKTINDPNTKASSNKTEVDKVYVPFIRKNRKMNWSKYKPLQYGEDSDYMADPRLREQIDEENRLRETLRENNPFERAENDCHPRDRTWVLRVHSTKMLSKAHRTQQTLSHQTSQQKNPKKIS